MKAKRNHVKGQKHYSGKELIEYRKQQRYEKELELKRNKEFFEMQDKLMCLSTARVMYPSGLLTGQKGIKLP